MKYCERIKMLRKNQGLNQAALGKILNLGQRTISQYETNGRGLPTSVIIKYAQYFNVTADYILGLSDNPQKGWLEDKK
ncbi:MAG TPA: helix-turn-helix transcriptional regulator [Candidatus Scatavimonas merdigallinarum]|uniref:Helix-turn-helix transcriptional regulator n=1 Tax=Candidatus Scatavimonas merdigallinarum TaxID=2840914 RepID=A0A9D1CUJ3_9FIRM|nr:helix-turn-helix transcriptional regulator [Candidatus Scatavimonas merdigallinarum]